MNNISTPRLLVFLATVVAIALLWSAVSPTDRLTWWLEVAPVLIAAPLLAFTYRRFPLTQVLYILVALHALVLILGGTYTYAEVPLGFWLQDMFSLARNPYDKIGHFMQGLVPALVAREILLRGGYIRRGRMLGFLSICVALAVSASYELIEWWAALIMGQGAEEFLGTQGDEWDAQSDMFFALLGALFAMAVFTGIQDRQLRRLE